MGRGIYLLLCSRGVLVGSLPTPRHADSPPSARYDLFYTTVCTYIQSLVNRCTYSGSAQGPKTLFPGRKGRKGIRLRCSDLKKMGIEDKKIRCRARGVLKRSDCPGKKGKERHKIVL